ncbi:MAG: hypothetical protein Q7U47_12460, partial [Paludibacter sp.]|nr:hypothetical protein [Paludibacter sp.]
MQIILSLSAQTPAWSPYLPVSAKVFSDVEKIQQRANGQKLLDTLKILVNNPTAAKTVLVKADCRFAGDGSFSIAALQNTKIMGLKGSDITFWFDAPHIFGINMTNCTNVSISNITFDCDPLPFTQGKVISKASSSSMVLQPMTGYETLISNANGIFVIFNPDGTFKKSGPLTCTMVQNADKTISLTSSGSFTTANVGDYIVLPSRTGSMISMSSCNNINLDSINIYASGGMGILASKGYGGHVLRHVIATRRPSTNRLWMSGADGMHFNELVNGPIIDDCEIAYTADDLINIHGRFGWVASKLNNSKNNLRIVCSTNAIKVGQKLDFWDNNTQEFRGSANVSSISTVHYSSEINAALATTNSIDFGGKVFDILLDADVNADLASLIEYHANVCSGFAVRNSRLHNTFNRGFLINGASNGVIDNNVVQNIGSGQQFHNQTCCWGEGQYIKNLIISNNTFKNAGDLWISTVPPNSNTMYGAFRSTPMKNISILNNRIELSAGEIGAINASYIDTLKIEGNTIVRNM